MIEQDDKIKILVHTLTESCDELFSENNFSKNQFIQAIPDLVLTCLLVYQKCTPENINQVLTLVLTNVINKYVKDPAEANLLLELLPSV